MAKFANEVWDTQKNGGAGGLHVWLTDGDYDPAGTYYDGPGTYGVDTSNYVRGEVYEVAAAAVSSLHLDTAGEVAALTEKGSPVAGDLLVIEDSAAGNVKKKVQVGNLPGGSGTDPDAIHDNVAGEIALVTEKASPISADLILIEDSADSNNKKRVQIGNLPGGSGTDPDAIHDNVAGEIALVTEKASPISADLLLIEDSADSNNKKRVQVGNLPFGSGTDANAVHVNAANEISGITEKSVLASADLFLIEDSADSNNKKKVQVGNLPGGSGTDPDAIHDNVSGEIAALTEKVAPTTSDIILIEDAAAANAKKKVQIGNLPSGGSSVLWEWNGTDITQFGDGLGGPTATDPARNGGNMSGSFSVVAATSEQTSKPLLKYTHTGGGGTGFWKINDCPTLPDRYIFEAAIGPRNKSPYTNTYQGVHPIYQDATHTIFIRRYTTATQLYAILSNSTQGWTTPSTQAGPSVSLDSYTPLLIRCYVDCVDPQMGVDPKITLHWGSIGTKTFCPVLEVFGSYFPDWQVGGTIKNPAISIYELTSAGSNVFSDLRILAWD